MIRSGGAARAVLPSRDVLLPRHRSSSRSTGLALCALGVAVAASAAMSIVVGSVALSPAAVLASLLHPHAGGLQHAIVWELRLPRVLLGMLVGAGLGIAGAMLQMLFRNPLVDPYVTGVSAGAALAAAAGFMLGVAFAAIPLVAFVGGVVSASIVAVVGAGAGPSANLRLVLAGVAVSALCAALVTLLLLRSGSTGGLSILAWLAGGLAGRGWTELGPVSVYLGAAMLICVTLVHKLNALRLGREAAAGLGLRVEAARWQVMALSAFITAACVSVSGVIGFVGLMVPHGARRIVGGDARRLLPASALGGAAVVVAADACARIAMPSTELPLGVLLAIIGVPCFLAIARNPVSP
ncbi:MAG: iron ABC transporter permease [Candidatus Eremiobacteraeota bacterium]|nr:iron ABC transporter permease [Candidatus Eremiobacteraeota bacterium]MBC5827665.1 iron ABC transporter permease [Candidatus Eremiobacteraeota bacterium]